MKKPDRFDRRAGKELAMPWVLTRPRLAMLFRNEHKAIVRLVKAEMRRQGYGNICNEAVRVATYEHLLAILAKRVQ
jgi:hypothetical protein